MKIIISDCNINRITNVESNNKYIYQQPEPAHVEKPVRPVSNKENKKKEQEVKANNKVSILF